MNTKKYMIVAHDPSTGLTQMTTPGGGAACMKTGKALCIALFTKDKACKEAGSDAPAKGKYQTLAGCADQVETMANYLAGAGY